MLNPASPLPLYHQLADKLCSAIAAGDWQPGDKLPSEQDLSRTYGIGRPTVRQATDVLIKRGLAERRRGSGTFVKASPGTVDLFTLSGTISSFRSSGHTLHTELLAPVRRTVVASDDVDNPFCAVEAYYMQRLGRLDSTPVLMEDIWLNPHVFPHLEQTPVAVTPLSDLVRQVYHLEPTDGEQSFHVVKGPDSVRRSLELSTRECLLQIQRTLNFAGVKSALFSRLYCCTDRVVFSQRLGGQNP
jgi:GntR family transcriptional regulator